MVRKELEKYRSQAKLTKQQDLANRLTTALKEISIKESQAPVPPFRNINYNKEKWKRFDTIVGRNPQTGRFISWQKYNPKLSMKKNVENLGSRIFTNLYDKEQAKIRKQLPDDGIGRGRKAKPNTRFRTYIYNNIIILAFIGPKLSPAQIFKNREFDLPENIGSLYPYQEAISRIKGEVLNKTGITLEEWIFLARTTNNYRIIGGWTWKLFESPRFGDDKFLTKRAVNLDKII